MSLDVSIQKRFGNAFSLDVAFQVDKACLGILGASGCGKSMTLKCIAGIERPDSGRIVLNGRVLFDSTRGVDLPPRERRVGFLFQSYALFPNMTVRENIAAGMPGKRGREERAGRLMVDFQLNGLGDRYPRELSGGQQQRAALARMLAADPEAVLLDEPLSALDAHLREYMQLRLLEIAEKVGDAVMVTHSRDEVYTVCPNLLVMDGGRVAAAGTTEGVFKDPGFLEVARITGCKNISRMTRISENRVYAVDWDMTLTTARSVPADATHVGIRAHDMIPADEDDAGAENVFAVNIRKTTGNPFELVVHFTNAEGRAGNECALLWWKVSKYLVDELPVRLFFPPAALMVLRSGEG